MDQETINQLQSQYNELRDQMERFQKIIDEDDHRHTGFDKNKVFWDDLNERKLYIAHTLPGALSATSSYYSTIWISLFDCYLSDFREVHATAGTDAGAVTLTLEKLTSTTAPGSGVSMLDSELSLKATANTVQTGTPTVTIANKNLENGDRLALKATGVLSSVANVTVLIELTMV